MHNDDLPYDFDLLWDIKSRNGLMTKLTSLLENAVDMLELIKLHNIETTEMEDLMIQNSLSELKKYIEN